MDDTTQLQAVLTHATQCVPEHLVVDGVTSLMLVIYFTACTILMGLFTSLEAIFYEHSAEQKNCL
jgi:hypothetical protein